MLPGRITIPVMTCGVKVAYRFDIPNDWGSDWEKPVPRTLKRSAGWCLAGFIKTKACKDAYHQWSKKYNIVYQSPVRKNRNSGRNFFLSFLTLQLKRNRNKCVVFLG